MLLACRCLQMFAGKLGQTLPACSGAFHRHAFGFLASRWGWEDGAYVEETLKSFRAGGFPLAARQLTEGIQDDRRLRALDWPKDSIIVDFEWFANTSDYDFSQEGQPWYDDFGWNPELFPSPARQLEKYRSDSISETPDRQQ